MVYAAEIFAPSGYRTNSSPAHAEVLTPKETLTLCLEEQRPLIFQLELGPKHEQPAKPELHGDNVVGLVLPVLDAQTLRACVTLTWRVEEFVGALEVWRPGASGALRLSDAYYGPQSTRPEPFEQTSRQTTFGVLEGLPGITFDAHEPVLFETLSQARGFVRAETAAAVGLSVGLGLPVFKHQAADCAVLLLSSAHSPLAQTFEVWKLTGRTLQLDSSQTLDKTKHAHADLATRAAKSKLPQLVCHEAVAVAIPVFRGKTVRSVVVLGNS